MRLQKDEISFEFEFGKSFSRRSMISGKHKYGQGLFSRAWKGIKKVFGYADEVSGSSRSVAQYQKFKQLYRSLMSKPPVTDPKLKDIIDNLYRANATVGSGSTAAVRQELATGQPVGGVFHTQKAKDSITALERWLKNNPSASASDRHAAE